MSTQPPETRSMKRKVARGVLFNMIPGYPIVAALRSARRTAGSGAETLRDLQSELRTTKSRARQVRTWREALEARPLDALPLAKIKADCVTRKRLSLIMVFFCLCSSFGYLVGGHYVGVFNGVLGIGLPVLFIVREEHRLWQMEAGPQQPDEPLPGYRQFFRSGGIALRLLNPRLGLVEARV
jgi:hypothetical protein